MAEDQSNMFVYKHLRCAQFNGTNHSEWHRQILRILQYINAKDLVEGTEEEPEVSPRSSTQEAAALESFQVRSREATSILTGSVAINKQYIIENVDYTPKAIWTRLQKELESGREASIKANFKAFMECKWLPEDTLDSFLSKIERLRYMMSGTEVQVNETWMRLKIVTSLPPVWNSVVQSLSATSYRSVEEVVLFLRKSEMEIVRAEESKDRALFTRSRQPAYRPSFTSRISKPRPSNTCHYCHKPGHQKKYCRKLRADMKRPQERNESANVAVDRENIGICLYASKSKSLSPGTWILDSGASRHMTGDKTLLSNYTSFEGPENHRARQWPRTDGHR